jgi:hypothetical protein
MMQHVMRFKRFFLRQSRTDCFAAVVLLLFLCGWHWRVTGFLSLNAGLSLVFLLALCIVYGNLFTRLIAPVSCGLAGLPFQVLTGYFVFNSLLFILALCSPLGMALNLFLLACVALAGAIAMRKRALPRADVPTSEHLAGCVAIALACIGATIWCGDVQMPLASHGGMTIFKVWPDVYIHAREISVFAQAHGIASIQDIKLAGERAPIYHFASYMPPAAISALSGASAMQVYASLQLPLGIVLTGLAAYCLMGKLFGWGPGLAATVAIVLFPDAFQQGFQNRYLSYNFMAQVNLGMLYGIACAALAWMFMLDGCRRGKYGPVLLAYIFLVICLFYKAHLFVANSYVLMMFPFLFFERLPRTWRLGLGLLATLVFCLAVSLSQSNPRVPLMRLDGSGIGAYVLQLLHDHEPGGVAQELRRIFVLEKHGLAIQALYAAALLLLSTFGFWLIGLAVALIKTWRTLPAMMWWFPVIITSNYMLMAMGLAFDTRGVGSADELLNRPLVWAYFVMASWTAAVGYRVLAGEHWPHGRARAGAAAVVVLGLCAALYSAPNLQTFPGHPANATFAASGSVPDCFVQAATYIRLHGGPADVVQDGAADPQFILAALSERQLYVGKGNFNGRSVLQTQRLAELADLVQMRDAGQVRQFLAVRGITWYLQQPDVQLAWPETLLSQPSFACGGFRLFHFPHAALTRASSSPDARTFLNKG